MAEVEKGKEKDTLIPQDDWDCTLKAWRIKPTTTGLQEPKGEEEHCVGYTVYLGRRVKGRYRQGQEICGGRNGGDGGERNVGDGGGRNLMGMVEKEGIVEQEEEDCQFFTSRCQSQTSY
ncbi:hypothetical protein Pmani_017731 [Petrolisthes manimaculis]|uniref:Uncharacterized protein n=1 Tax=Petrolisthes manimaculis TaxID=1843537 RepID=A0AAE1U944_9EUCA|nr:hypothetical protein Pmani_017731 [Petrolisthes manimaculis]